MNLLLLLVMFCAGLAIAVQPLVNARLAQKVGVLESACISFAVGTLALVLMIFVTGKGNLKGVADTVWWEWTGGVMGAFFVSIAIFVVPRIGSAATMSAVIAAQIIAGVTLDHFGFLGLRHIPLDFKRTMGCLLLLGGVALIAKR